MEMTVKKRGRLLAIYSLGHFLVDLTCAFVMLNLASAVEGDRLLCFLLYNFCAFAIQMPAGLIADKLDKNAAVAAAGLILTMVSFLCYPIPLLCAVILGMGNCLYHVGGGVDVLNFSDTEQWMLGVYVSPGAIGLFVGGILAGNEFFTLQLGFAVMLVAFLLITLALHLTCSLKAPSGNAKPSIKPSAKKPIISAIALMLVVVMRSYVGLTMKFEWKTGALAVFAVLGLALGKAAGGFLADRFGAIRTSVISLSLSAGFFLLSDIPICGLSAIFLFNMTMPLTLFAMSRIFDGARGFAFGALTFALFLGYFPTVISSFVPLEGETLWYTAASLISLLLLTVGLAFGREDNK